MIRHMGSNASLCHWNYSTGLAPGQPQMGNALCIHAMEAHGYRENKLWKCLHGLRHMQAASTCRLCELGHHDERRHDHCCDGRMTPQFFQYIHEYVSLAVLICWLKEDHAAAVERLHKPTGYTILQRQLQHALVCCRALDMLAQEEDPVMREALRTQMMEFGRTPKELFEGPHPRRHLRPGRKNPMLCCVRPVQHKQQPHPPTNLLGAIK